MLLPASSRLSFLPPTFNSSLRWTCINGPRHSFHSINRTQIRVARPFSCYIAARRQAAISVQEDTRPVSESGTPQQLQSKLREQRQQPQPQASSGSYGDTLTADINNDIGRLLDFTRNPSYTSSFTHDNAAESAQSSTSITHAYDKTGVISRLRGDPSNVKNVPWGSMLYPAGRPDISTRDIIQRQTGPRPLPTPYMVLGPSAGRTVKLNTGKGLDLGIAFKILESKCGRNKVKQDFYAQRFHERPGLKRKRLKMQRWRRRFKTAFMATVDRVMAMKRKGW